MPVDLRGLRHMREVQPETGDGERAHRAGLTPPVPRLAVVAAGGHLLPRQRTQRVVKRRLVPLDHEQVVRPLRLHQPPGVVTVGTQGVGTHHDTGQVERGQQLREADDLGGLVRHPQLADCASDLQDGGEQVGGRAGVRARAAGGFAVHGQVPAARGVASEQVGKPAGTHQGQEAADDGARRRAAHAQRAGGAHAEAGECIQGRAAGPLAHGQIGARPGQHRAAGGEQDRYQQMAPSPPISRIAKNGQPFGDTVHATLGGSGRLGQADSARLAAHRSSGRAGRLGKVTPSTGASLCS